MHEICNKIFTCIYNQFKNEQKLFVMLINTMAPSEYERKRTNVFCLVSSEGGSKRKCMLSLSLGVHSSATSSSHASTFCRWLPTIWEAVQVFKRTDATVMYVSL